MLQLRTMVAAGSIGLLLLTGGCSQHEELEAGDLDRVSQRSIHPELPAPPPEEDVSWESMDREEPVDLYPEERLSSPFAPPEVGVGSRDTELERRMPQERKVPEVATVEDYDFTTMPVPDQSYSQLRDRLLGIEQTLDQAEDLAASTEERQGLRTLDARAESLAEDVADVDLQPQAEAPDDVTQQTWEVEAEVDEFYEELRF